jgi:uncharacterized membrane protein
MTPIGELRLSIPLGIWVLKMPWYQAFLISLVGNVVPVLFLVPGLERISRWLQAFPNPLGAFLTWRARRLREAHAERFQRYGYAALALFVGVPLPLTGAWTGSLLAWAFQVPWQAAIPVIGTGVLMAGVIVTALTVAGVQASIFLAGP